MKTNKANVANENMQNTIDRLRVSKRKGDQQMYEDGFERGQEWARDRAEVAD